MQGMLRGFVATAGVLALALAGSTAAQDRQATVLLKSGERVTGQFQDIQNNQVYVRTGQNDERRLALDQVVSIDFSGGPGKLSQNDLGSLRSSDDLLIMANGTRLTGELVDVTREGEGGERTIADAPVTFVFRSTAGRQEIPAQQVSAVYLKPGMQTAQSTTATGTTGAAAMDTPGRYTVSSTRQWTPTGIMVRSGQMVSFNASGEVQLGNGEVARPAGVSTQRREPSSPLSNTYAGALIGRVGNSAPFGIGDQTGPIRMPASGELFLGVNDGQNLLGDNSGEFTVQVTVQPMRTRR